MMAVSRNNSEVADVLLEAGADVNLQSNDVSDITTFTHSKHVAKYGKGHHSCTRMDSSPTNDHLPEGKKDSSYACCKEWSIFHREVVNETQTRCQHQRCINFRSMILSRSPLQINFINACIMDSFLQSSEWCVLC